MDSVLSITIDPYTRTSLHLFAQGEYLRAQHVVTVNAEMALAARADAALARAIAGADVRVIDSFGFRTMGRFFGLSMPARITGVDLMQQWLADAWASAAPVYLLGATPQTLEALRAHVHTAYPGLPVRGTAQIHVAPDGSAPETAAVLADIAAHQTRFLFVAFGHGKQECWIAKNRAALPPNCIAMGVGGSFAYIAGTTRRAPCWMRVIGLEWLWRLAHDPRRILRICRAVFVFPLYALWYHIRYAYSHDPS